MDHAASVPPSEGVSLAVGWALGILTASEHARFEQHLIDDPGLQLEADAFLGVAAFLAANAPPVTPPPSLKEQIMAHISEG